MNKNLIYILLFVAVLQACIEPFAPELEESQRYLVINGLVTDQEGYQYAEVSWSSSFENRSFKPYDNCSVKIVDDKGGEFLMENYDKGKYRVWMEKKDLQTSRKYKLAVTTEYGRKYESAYDKILPCPEVDNMYYEFQEKRFDDPNRYPIKGIQIFVDSDATGNYANHFRWELVETWMYKAYHLIYAYYDGREIINLNIDNPIDSLNVCWRTMKVRDVFTYSTAQKSSKKLTRVPLNYVSNKSDRLRYKYSLLIKQFSLSDSAFAHWEQLEKSKESGGLYETQPNRVSGNFSCIDDKTEIVLGFFSASAVSEKRFFIDRVNIFNFTLDCGPTITDPEELWNFLLRVKIEDAPVYLINSSFTSEGPWYYTDQNCFDCRLDGGTIYEPDFWE